MALYRPGDPWAMRDIGQKALGLEEIVAAGLSTPDWIVIPASLQPPGVSRMPVGLRGVVVDAAQALLGAGGALAVRSSALDEDDLLSSFAGQYTTVLDLHRAGDVPAAVERCWQSADSMSVRAYRQARGLPARSPGIAVIVQRMAPAAVAGICFSQAPTGPSGETAIVAVAGLADRLAHGEIDGEEYRVAADGEVVHAALARPLAARDVVRLLDDAQAGAIAGAARLLAARAGVPRDIEWALSADGALSILQTRPITAQEPAAGDDVRHGVRLWDNSNIIESFPGITLPLTFTIARESYAAVYRGACRLLGVSAQAIEDNTDVFEQLLGHIDGRVYYDVSSWHRLLGLLPGFATNQALLERMMGARRPGEAGESAAPIESVRHRRLSVARIGVRAAIGVTLFERRATRFERTVSQLRKRVMGADLGAMSAGALLELYEWSSQRALAAWPVTIFNDLAVMILHGSLRRLTDRWLGESGHAVVNTLLRTGGVASTAPARELDQLAQRLRSNGAALEILSAAADPLAEMRIDASVHKLRESFEEYVERWGDYAPRGLQLEQSTYSEDPAALLATVIALAARNPDEAVQRAASSETGGYEARRDLTRLVATSQGRTHWLRALILRWLVARVRPRLAWREQMRGARTHVFAAARRTFAALGERLAQEGRMAEPGDIHYLELDELRDLVRGGSPEVGAHERIRRRKALYAAYAAEPEPPARFETRGPATLAAASASTGPHQHGFAGGARVLRGTGVAPGIVRARCVLIIDARHAVPPIGQIVVTHSTDPGWVPLMLAAAGLLVERGSLLSHSAIIARELGLPTIVGLAGVTQLVATGELAWMDGALGEVRLVRGQNV